MSSRVLMSNDSDGDLTLQDQFLPIRELCGYYTDNITLASGCTNSVDTQGTENVETYSEGLTSQLSGLQVVLLVYTLPVVIFLGILGNALTLYIIRSSPLKKSSVCLYMCAYCVSNILSLSLYSGLEWLYLIAQERHFQHYSDPICRLWQFFIRLVSHSGVWFVVAMTIDRYIAVWHQHKRKEMCTKFVAKLVTCIIMVGLVVVSVHALWTFSISIHGCVLGNDPGDLHSVIYSWTSFMCYSLFPIALIFIFGNLICARLCMKTKEDEHERTEVTQAAVVICCFYFFLASPVVVIDLILNTLPQFWKDDDLFVYRLQSCRLVADVMLHVAYATIFPVLCVCCQKFRICLVRKFSCGGKRNIRLECTAV